MKTPESNNMGVHAAKKNREMFAIKKSYSIEVSAVQEPKVQVQWCSDAAMQQSAPWITVDCRHQRNSLYSTPCVERRV